MLLNPRQCSGNCFSLVARMMMMMMILFYTNKRNTIISNARNVGGERRPFTEVFCYVFIIFFVPPPPSRY